MHLAPLYTLTSFSRLSPRPMKENQVTPKKQSTMIINKLILSCIFFIFLLYLILKANSPSFKLAINSASTTICNKIPPSLAESFLHYATTNKTIQQKHEEISVTLRVLEKKSPCNFLVFGLGYDSVMWNSLNHNGRTVFIEENIHWLDKITKQVPSLEAHYYSYDTRLDQAPELLSIGKREDSCKSIVGDPRNSKCPLALTNFPKLVYETEWDLIMIDAPTGSYYNTPGRMKVIYTAGLLARNREYGETDVFVHDCLRYVEDKFSRNFLCEGYIREEVRFLRHFTIPSYRNGSIKSFCP